MKNIGLSRQDLLSNALVVALTATSTAPLVFPHTAMSASATVENKALTMAQTAELIRTSCKPILETYRATQRFLYRGENDLHRPTLLVSAPDLLDPTTYRDRKASDYFGRLDDAMRGHGYPIRPSEGHLATSDVRCAAAWGIPCSIWPLGSLYYAWLPNYPQFWPLENAPDAKQAFERFVSREMKVNEGLNAAVCKGHEVLLKCTLDESNAPTNFGYLAVPLVYERELRARLGLKYE